VTRWNVLIPLGTLRQPVLQLLQSAAIDAWIGQQPPDTDDHCECSSGLTSNRVKRRE
jgi:hypothetical protein